MKAMLPAAGRREANKADKLQRIRRATTKVFRAQGFADATMREIAEEAGVALGTIFLYAKDKQDLLLLIFEEQFPPLRQRAFRRAKKEALLIDQLVAFFDTIQAFFLSTPRLSKDMLREVYFSSGIVTKRIGVDMAAFERCVADLIASSQARGTIRRNVSPDLAARLIFNLHRMEIRLCINEERPNRKACLARLRAQLELLLQGLAA